jgi:hypothetical protein
MTTPLLSAIAAIVYFGWLWHDRTAASLKSPAGHAKEGVEDLLARRRASISTERSKRQNRSVL